MEMREIYFIDKINKLINLRNIVANQIKTIPEMWIYKHIWDRLTSSLYLLMILEWKNALRFSIIEVVF